VNSPPRSQDIGGPLGSIMILQEPAISFLAHRVNRAMTLEITRW
jgi:hypothetical protein